MERELKKRADRNRTPVQLQTRAAIQPSTFNDDDGTVEVVFTTGARGLRRSWDLGTYYEELEVSAKALDLSRLNNGASVLNAHSNGSLDDVIGVVDRAWIANGEGRAKIRFSTRDEVKPIRDDVKAGIIRHLSVGYSVQRYEKVEEIEGVPVMRATRWTPAEISFVPVAFDDAAVVRAKKRGAESQDTEVETRGIPPRQEKHMKTGQAKRSAAPDVSGPPIEISTTPDNTEQIRATERERISGIHHAVRAAERNGVRIPETEVQKMIDGNATVDQARALVLDKLAERSESLGIDGHNPNASGVEFTEPTERGDYATQRVRAMAEALASRFGGPAPSDPAKQYLRLSAVDMARHLLEARGVSTRMMSKSQIVSRALNGATTSDFPALLQETGHRVLRNAYESYPGGVRVIAKEATVPDFRARNLLMLGEAPALQKVNEQGEFKRGAMASTKASYSLSTYGEIFGLSRQAIVNDDLGAFSDLSGRLGRAAAEFISQQLATLLTSNPVMSADGVALFDAAHGNIGTPAAISVASVGEGFKLLRLQKGLDGVTPINASPKYLVVPAALETVARQIAREINPTKVSDVNPFVGDLSVVVDPRLDANSSTRWYLAADPALIDTLEYAFLDGEGGPFLDMKLGWEIDGAEFKCRLDFGCAAIDHRGLCRNDGA